MRHGRFTLWSAVLCAGVLAVPAIALTTGAAGAATINVPANIPNPGSTGFDTGIVATGGVSVSGSGTWCTNNVPADCNGPDGLTSWVMAPNFLYQVAGTAFALVGRIGTTGPWTLVGTGPTSISGTGTLYLAMNDEVGQFGDNNGTIQATVTAPTVSGTIAPVSSTVTVGKDAVWSVPIVNDGNAPLTNVSASVRARANGTTPLDVNEALMPGCTASEGDVETCDLPDVPAHSTTQFLVYMRTTGLANGATAGGSINLFAAGAADAGANFGAVTIQGCGSACVVAVGAPGVPVSSSPGPPTDLKPTKQIVVLPTNKPKLPPVAITLNSLNPGPRASAADKVLCPLVGKQCSGQISVVAGNFSKYNDKAHPVRVQIIARWKTNVPPGRLLMMKPVGPPIQLADCAYRKGMYNTPCQQKEVVTGSAARHNLTTTTTILFVGTDPHIGRRASNLADAPTAVKATAAKKSAIVQWKAPVVTNGAITGYLVTPRIGKVLQRLVSFKGTGTKRTVSGLVPGKKYTFTVATRNAHGLSLPSIPSKPITVK